jgi:hypothetical protein
MARVLALVPDLMFGSRVQSSLAAAGHEVELLASQEALRARLADASQQARADVLVVDLTGELDGARVLADLPDHALPGALSDGRYRGLHTLAFYSHVEAHVRGRAVQAGFDLVVPRSRMAREGAELVSRLVGGPPNSAA